MWSKILNDVLLLKDSEKLLVVVDEFYEEMSLGIIEVCPYAKILIMHSTCANVKNLGLMLLTSYLNAMLRYY